MKLKNFNKKTHPEILESDPKLAGLGRDVANRMAAMPLSCTGDVFRLILHANNEDMQDPNIAVSGRVLWANVQWVRSGRPILRLDDDLRDLLLKTEPPTEPLDVLPKIPFDGFYLVVDGGFQLYDQISGLHQVEGIYVCRDQMYKSHVDKTMCEALLVIAVGEDKGGVKDGLLRDDTLSYFGIIAGGDPEVYKHANLKIKETLQVVLNLLLLWNSEKSPVTMKTVEPPQPKSPGKRKKLERRGMSSVKYIRIGLERDYLRHDVNTDAVQGWDGPTHIAMIRGFFRRYWVVEKPETQVLGERLSATGRPLYLIRRFVAPHKALRRGEAPTPNMFEVTT